MFPPISIFWLFFFFFFFFKGPEEEEEERKKERKKRYLFETDRRASLVSLFHSNGVKTLLERKAANLQQRREQLIEGVGETAAVSREMQVWHVRRAKGGTPPL
jgi:hypothetical protein